MELDLCTKWSSHVELILCISTWWIILQMIWYYCTQSCNCNLSSVDDLQYFYISGSSCLILWHFPFLFDQNVARKASPSWKSKSSEVDSTGNVYGPFPRSEGKHVSFGLMIIGFSFLSCWIEHTVKVLFLIFYMLTQLALVGVP